MFNMKRSRQTTPDLQPRSRRRSEDPLPQHSLPTPMQIPPLSDMTFPRSNAAPLLTDNSAEDMNDIADIQDHHEVGRINYRTFSKEWMHAVATGNASGILCAVMCIAIYCQMTSQMLLFAVLLAGCCAVVLVVRKYEERQQSSTQRTVGIQKLRSKEDLDDEALAIKRFQRSFKPFIAWALVSIAMSFANAVFYPSMQLPSLIAIVGLMVAVTFRFHLIDSNNQGRVRWLFGWFLVGLGMLGTLVVAVCPINAHIDLGLVVSCAVLCALLFAFLNIGGIPDLCRVILVFLDASTILSLPIDWKIDEHAISIVGGMLFGEIVGRLSVQHGRVSATKKAVHNNFFQSSFEHLAMFSAIFALLELCLAVLKPNLAAPCILCIAMHMATVGGRWYLRGVADRVRARWLFGWGWTIMLVGKMAAFAFVFQQQTLHSQFGAAVISGGALMWLLIFVYLNIIGAPWLARWTILCLMPALVVFMPSPAARTLMLFFGAMVVGEVLGQLWVQCRLHADLHFLLRWWSLAFDDESREQEYVTNRFEKSYSPMVVCCAVAAVLSCVWASRFPNDDMLALSPLAFLLGMLFFRFHTERTVPREHKRAYFGFGMVILTLLVNMAWAGGRWSSLHAQAASPVAIGVCSCCLMMFVVASKLMCLPERHRQGINVIFLGCSVISPPWPTLGTANETTVLVIALLVVELIAFTLDYKRRSSHQATDSLRQELHSKEAQMKLAVDTISMPACITDNHMKLVYANYAALAMFGYTEEEITNKHARVLMMASSSEKCDEFAQHFRHSSVGSPLSTISREIQGRHKDGRPLELCLTLSTSPDRMFFMATFRDIAAEKAHVKRHRNMKLALDTTLSPIAMTNSDFALTYVNKAMCTIFGYAEDEMVGHDIGMVTDDATRAEHHAAGEEFQKTGNCDAIVVVGREVQGRHKDGRTLHLRLSRNVTDDRKLFVMSFQDMSAAIAQRESERKLKQHAFLRSLYAAMSGTIAYEVANQGIEWVAGATASILGYNHEEWKVMHPLQTLLTDESKRVAEKAIQSMRNGQPVQMAELECTHRDGHTVWLRLDKTSCRLPSENELVVLHDVTAEVRLRKANAAKKREIEEAISKRFSTACTFLSHEVRNQLYPQTIFLEEMKDAEPKWKDSIDMALAANATVTTILSRVLDLAKWDTGKFPVNKTFFPIANLFNTIASYARANGASVKGLPQVDQKWHVHADEHLLKQAATHLVSNAAKFGDGKPVSVDVAFEQTNHEEGVIVVTVTDKGRGMTPDQLAKVMMPFGQIRKAGEARSGTGLGLSLTKAMIEAGHKGTLALTSKGLGKGTTATIRVPVLWEDRHEEPRQEFDPLWWVAPHPGATADILVVDDVKLNRMVILMAAKKMGLTFHEAADGSQAVDLLRTNTYSIVFMDREMPVMTGDVATEQARANGYILPIVMVSGNTFKASEKKELKLRGITAFLDKMTVPGPRHAIQKLRKMKTNIHVPL